MNIFSFLFKKAKKEYPERMVVKTITKLEDLKQKINIPFVFVVFDTETNGFTKKQGVLSVSALKYYYDGVNFTNIGSFERFYFPKGKLNKEAVAVNGLTRKAIRKMRKGFKWPRYWFKDMNSFKDFIGNDTELMVGHNISFDRRFYWFLDSKKCFDTMHFSRNRVGSLDKNGRIKAPKLIDTAKSYGIEIEEEKLHYSSYDTELTFKVFEKMISDIFCPVF